jgi:predicted DNA-binding transcriptional regulator YafY
LQFDLSAYWSESTAAFERELRVGVAEVRVTKRGLRRLKEMSDPVANAATLAGESFDADGWMQLTIPIEETSYAVAEMSRVGTDIEVLSPKELRDAMTSIAQRLAEIYSVRARSRKVEDFSHKLIRMKIRPS